MADYTLEIFGELKSHKNEKFAVLRKRKRDTPKGAAGSYYSGLATKPAAKKAMQDAALQIPGFLRNRYLRHPEIEVEFEVARDDVDRDNIYSTLLDLLREFNVIEEDNVRHFNGRVILHPARVTDHWRTVVTLRCPTVWTRGAFVKPERPDGHTG